MSNVELVLPIADWPGEPLMEEKAEKVDCRAEDGAEEDAVGADDDEEDDSLDDVDEETDVT